MFKFLQPAVNFNRYLLGASPLFMTKVQPPPSPLNQLFTRGRRKSPKHKRSFKLRRNSPNR